MDKDSFCRLCAESISETSFISINDPIAINLNLSYKICHCFHLKIDANDILSKNICSKCFGQVILTYNFYECILKAQETLKTALLEADDFILPEMINDEETDKLKPYDNLEHDDTTEQDHFVEDLLSDANIYTETRNEETQTQESSLNSTEQKITQSKYKKKKLKRNVVQKRHKRKRNSLTSNNEIPKTPNNDTHQLEIRNIEEEDEEIQSQLSEICEIKINDDESVTITPPKEGWETYPWKCFTCGIQLTSVVELRNHHTSTHDQAAQYVCADCDKPAYTIYHGFLAHVRIHRPLFKFCCDLCGKFFVRKHVMDFHRLQHSELKPYPCEKCDKTFRTQSALCLHSRSHLPEDEKNMFACDLCPKKFGTKPNLVAHKRIHAGIKDYTCDQCGKSFVQKGNLENHMLTHTAARPFNCDICCKSFKTLMRLKKHESVHSGLKPHQCDTCGRQFREKGTLKEHHRIHTGAMPFTCEYCGKCFRFKGILTTHRRQHTGERPYSCLECQHHFTNWPNYNKHMKRRHGINTSVTVRKPQTIPPTGMPRRNPPGTVVIPPISNITTVPTLTTTISESTIQQSHPNLNVPQQLSHMIVIHDTPNSLTQNVKNQSCDSDLDQTSSLINSIGVNVALTNAVSASSLLNGTQITTNRSALLNTAALLESTNQGYFMPNVLGLYTIDPTQLLTQQR